MVFPSNQTEIIDNIVSGGRWRRSHLLLLLLLLSINLAAAASATRYKHSALLLKVAATTFPCTLSPNMARYRCTISFSLIQIKETGKVEEKPSFAASLFTFQLIQQQHLLLVTNTQPYCCNCCYISPHIIVQHDAL